MALMDYATGIHGFALDSLCFGAVDTIVVSDCRFRNGQMDPARDIDGPGYCTLDF